VQKTVFVVGRPTSRWYILRFRHQNFVKVLGLSDRLLLKIEVGKVRIINHSNIMYLLILEHVLLNVLMCQTELMAGRLILWLRSVLYAYVRICRVIQTSVVVKIEFYN
jgi:hypothetical protein